MTKERRKRPGAPPLPVQIEVARETLRDIGAYSIALQDDRKPHKQFLDGLLNAVAWHIGCQRADLRLDHDPMLRVRKYRPRRGTPIAAWYSPHAHDRRYLKWRPQPPQFEGSHHVKTYVRGERGQYSDVALAKRQRRREKDPTRWTEVRGLAKPKRRRAPRLGSGQRIPSRPFNSKGKRPFQRRTK